MSSFVTPNDADSSSSSSSSSSSHSPPSTMYTSSPVIIAFSLGILICFFLGFCVIYICRCCFMNSLYAWAFQRTASDNLVHRLNSPTAAQSPSRGLDPLLLRIFPTFSYSSVREFHEKNKNPTLECAICLLEFEDGSLLRLLTVCYHVFHQECIDLWLRTHKTCPVCRTDLDSPTEKRQENVQIVTDDYNNNNNNNNNETRIDIVKEEDGAAQVSTSQQVREREGESEEDGEEGKRFSRSHSTGHSIVVIRGEEARECNTKNDDKYTLILPEHIQIKLIKGGHNYTKSCATYKEMTILCSKCSLAEVIPGC